VVSVEVSAFPLGVEENAMDQVGEGVGETEGPGQVELHQGKARMEVEVLEED